MEIGLGVLTGACLPVAGKTQHGVVLDSIPQMQVAEEVGLDAFRISEHTNDTTRLLGEAHGGRMMRCHRGS